MRLRVIDTNFTAREKWIFKLSDERGHEAFIMDSKFYKSHKLTSPITKKELDYLDKGYWLTCTTEDIEGLQVVISII